MSGISIKTVDEAREVISTLPPPYDIETKILTESFSTLLGSCCPLILVAWTRYLVDNCRSDQWYLKRQGVDFHLFNPTHYGTSRQAVNQYLHLYFLLGGEDMAKEKGSNETLKSLLQRGDRGVDLLVKISALFQCDRRGGELTGGYPGSANTSIHLSPVQLERFHIDNMVLSKISVGNASSLKAFIDSWHEKRMSMECPNARRVVCCEIANHLIDRLIVFMLREEGVVDTNPEEALNSLPIDRNLFNRLLSELLALFPVIPEDCLEHVRDNGVISLLLLFNDKLFREVTKTERDIPLSTKRKRLDCLLKNTNAVELIKMSTRPLLPFHLWK